MPLIGLGKRISLKGIIWIAALGSSSLRSAAAAQPEDARAVYKNILSAVIKKAEDRMVESRWDAALAEKNWRKRAKALRQLMQVALAKEDPNERTQIVRKLLQVYKVNPPKGSCLFCEMYPGLGRKELQRFAQVIKKLKDPQENYSLHPYHAH